MRRGSIGNIFAAFVSFLFPGLGQLFQGRFAAGVGFIIGYLSLGILLYLYFFSGELSAVWVILPILLLVWLWSIADAGGWEPEVRRTWTEADERNWAIEEKNRDWTGENEQLKRIRNSVVIEADGADIRYPGLLLGNLGIFLDVDENHRVRVVFPKLTPTVDLEYVDSWYNNQSIRIPDLEKMDGQNKLNFRVALILALPVREHLQFVEPEILNLRRQKNKIGELLNLVAKSEVYATRRGNYEEALLQVEELLNKSEELQRLYVRLIREVLIGKQIAGTDFQPTADKSLSIDDLVKKAKQEYQTMKNAATAYTELQRTGQI